VKTIFITIFQAVEAKNTIRTSIVKDLLREKDVKIVFLTQDRDRVTHFAREFVDNDRVLFISEPYPAITGIDRIFSILKFHLLRTPTTKLMKYMAYEIHGSFSRYFVTRIFNYFFARPFFRKIARFLDYHLVKNTPYRKYFMEHKPDLVLMLHLFDDPEIHLLREARHFGVQTVGMINTWDKTTSRCILRLLPDKIIVFNEFVKNEVIEHNEVLEKDVFIGGVPQYDVYFSTKPVPRAEFMRHINVALDRRVILFSVMGEAFSTQDEEIIDCLKDMMLKGEIPTDIVLLVRFVPYDAVDKSCYTDTDRIRYEFPGVRFSYTSIVAVDWDMNEKEIYHLRDTLAHSEMLICYATSLSIESAIYDKPVININFEVKSGQPLLKSPTQFFKTDHYKKALRSGGIRLVSSRQELGLWINRYLEHSEIDREERKLLVQEQCSITDGTSGARIAGFLLSLI
jgi:hypothetical protein